MTGASKQARELYICQVSESPIMMILRPFMHLHGVADNSTQGRRISKELWKSTTLLTLSTLAHLEPTLTSPAVGQIL